MSQQFNRSTFTRLNGGRGAALAFGTAALAVAGIASPTLADVVNFASGNGGFTSSLNTASFEGPWVYNPTGGSGGGGAWTTAGQNSYIGYSCTTDLTSGSFVVSSGGAVQLSFNHRFSFEVDSGGRWDAGAVFISRNGGAFTMVDSSAFSSNGYNALVSSWDQGSQLGGSLAFTGTSDGYGTGALLASVANLGTFNAGDVLQLKFRAAFDSNTVAGTPSWAIEGVSVTNTVPGPGALALMGAGAVLGGRRRRR